MAIPCFLLLACIAGSCSLRRYVLDELADGLAANGSTLASDEDPDLVRAAAPFSLKLLESLLAEMPGHQGLLSAAASGFTRARWLLSRKADLFLLEDP